MSSARRRKANRANARASTGPRTVVGKARSACNARRHGLSLPVVHDPTLSSEAPALAHAIAGSKANAERQEAACRIAWAQIDLVRVRCARWQLIVRLERDAAGESFPTKLIGRLAALDRYERAARARRKRAMRAFDAIGLPPPSVRVSCRTKPMSQRALLRLAGWKDPLADYLRGYPGLLRALSGGNSDRTCDRDFSKTNPTNESANVGERMHRARDHASVHRNLAETNPADETARTAKPAARRPGRDPARFEPGDERMHHARDDATGHRDFARTNPTNESCRTAMPAAADGSDSGAARSRPSAGRLRHDATTRGHAKNRSRLAPRSFATNVSRRDVRAGSSRLPRRRFPGHGGGHQHFAVLRRRLWLSTTRRDLGDHVLVPGHWNEQKPVLRSIGGGMVAAYTGRLGNADIYARHVALPAGRSKNKRLPCPSIARDHERRPACRMRAARHPHRALTGAALGLGSPT
jgi:hypothetical protein